MYKLYERKAPAAFQSHYVCSRARRVQTRRSRMEVHRLWARLAAYNRLDRETDGYFVVVGRRVLVSQGH